MQTRSQRMAATAAARVTARAAGDGYRAFAREFPTLVHTCGLAQAVAFAQAKGAKSADHRNYLDDLAAVLVAAGYAVATSGSELEKYLRAAGTAVPEYVRVSRDAIDAAVWLKRYAEAARADQPAASEEAKA